MQNRRTLLTAVSGGAMVSLLAIAAIDVTPKSARADDQGAFDATLTVEAIISQTCAPGDTTCSDCLNSGGLLVDAQGIAQTTLGPLFAKVLKCAYPNPSAGAPYGSFAGTLTLSTTPPSNLEPPKDVLTLNYAAKNIDAGDFYGFEPFTGTLTIESGTGNFQGAQGTLNFIAQGGPAIVVAAGNSPIFAQGMAFYHISGTINQGNSQ